MGNESDAARLQIAPSAALVDERVAVKVTGLAPSERVTLRATMKDDAGWLWQSEAVFEAGARGEVDIASQAPKSGSYAGVEPMGLFWSMASELNPGGAPFAAETLDPTPITIIAKVRGQIAETAILSRSYVAPGVTRTVVRDRGLFGTFFLPPVAGPFPAVMVMGGSGGGLREERAAALASHGFATLALAYFLYPGLPSVLDNIPLEYFETALHWMGTQPGVASDRLAVMGASRGGELVLLLGTIFPDVKAVIGYVPSGLVYGGIGGKHPGAAWTYQGKPIPHMRPRTSMDSATLAKRFPNQPIPLTPLFMSGLEDHEAVAAATIPVERIGGPVLLISGTDDQMWPSHLYSELVVRRLKEKGFKYPVKHVACQGAGHMISHPYPPATVTHSRHPVTGEDFAYGGNAAAYAHASEQSWAEVLTFLRAYL